MHSQLTLGTAFLLALLLASTSALAQSASAPVDDKSAKEASASKVNASSSQPATKPKSEAPATQAVAAPSENAELNIEDVELSDEEKAFLESIKDSDDDVSASPAPAQNVSPLTQFMGNMLQNANPNMALIVDVALAAFSENENFQTGAHDPTNNGFNLQQVEMSLGANVDPFFRLDANIVFAQFGVEVEEAYATSLALPYRLQFRTGQFLTRMGRVNSTHPHTWKFVDQPLVIGKFYGGEGNRGLGFEGSWILPLPWYTEFVSSMINADNACCNRTFLAADSFDIETPIDFLFTNSLKQFFEIDAAHSLSLGLNFQNGPNAAGRFSRSEIYSADLYYRYRPPEDPGRSSFSVHGEVFHRRRQNLESVLADTGGFLSATYRFALQYEVAARLEAVSGVANDPLDPLWQGTRTRSQAQFTYYPSHFSRIRTQLNATQAGDPNAALGVGGKTVWAGVVAFEILIGAHGAHDF